MGHRRGIWLVALAVALGACASWEQTGDLRAELLSEATLDCFAAALEKERGEPVFCETSAVAVSGEEVILASDKPVPGASSFFSVRLQGNRVMPDSARPIMASALIAASKVEEMTRTPDGAYTLAITAFDRYNRGSPEFDSFNMLLVWPTEKPEQARLVAPSTRNGVSSSAGLRERFVEHLGQPYFKIEGLMVLPGQRLVFGIRETGRDYEHFDYRMLLVETRYQITADGNWVLSDELRTLADFSSPTARGLHAGLGLSSLAYDPRNGRVLLTTTHESGERPGAYLWYSDLDSLARGRAPRPVRGRDGAPYHFEGKVEGLAVLPDGRLFLICDDDRVLGGKYQRRPNQAVYFVLDLVPGRAGD